MDPVRRWASLIALLLSAMACGQLVMQRLEQPRLGREKSSAPVSGGVFGVIPEDASHPARFIKCAELEPEAIVGEPLTYNELALSKRTP
jgi:hypothetical protein